jgi:2-polyprenyl-3-methyl-5-hydroxy-6-metoxy-1,4-benzoquinol methylase
MTSPRVERGIVVGNTYDKYTTRNPIARRLMKGFLDSYDSLLERSGATTALEVGCGEGELALRAAEAGLSVHGTDVSESMIRIAQSRASERGLPVQFTVDDVFALEATRPPPDLVICCEVLEHLAEPERALDKLFSLQANRYLFSVPNEPLWRVLNVMRGRYLGSLGNTPGHLQHWSRRQFLDLIGGRFTVLTVRSPTPWTMLLARR